MKVTDEIILKKSLVLWLEVLNNIDGDTIWEDNLKTKFIESIKEAEMKNGQVLWPIRVALSWEEFSPWAFEMIHIYGVKKSREILSKVLATLT
jgi:glutamyl/glutaminyl-tRNA synthetase